MDKPRKSIFKKRKYNHVEDAAGGDGGRWRLSTFRVQHDNLKVDFRVVLAIVYYRVQ
jgi:hypothetical protein